MKLTPNIKLQAPMLLLALSLFSIATLTQAEILKDPTQAPASIYNNTDAANPDQPAISGPVLQSVMIGEHYHAAIINGQKVMLGKKYEQATLVKLNESEAVLRNPDGSTQTLTMNYAIEKRIIKPVTPAPVSKRKPKPAPKTSPKLNQQ